MDNDSFFSQKKKVFFTLVPCSLRVQQREHSMALDQSSSEPVTVYSLDVSVRLLAGRLYMSLSNPVVVKTRLF